MALPASKISGSFVYPVAYGERTPSTVDEMNAVLQNLERKKQEWAEKNIEYRLGYLETASHCQIGIQVNPCTSQR
jgi:hypothetical protein